MQASTQSNELLTKRCADFSYEVAAVRAAALIACIPRSEAREFTFAKGFLAQSLQGLESKVALIEVDALERAASEFRTPLGSLRLALRIGFISLEKGDTLDMKILQEALVQVEQLIARITELLSNDAMSDG
jgi:signal transduction histidine kinase